MPEMSADFCAPKGVKLGHFNTMREIKRKMTICDSA